MNKDEFYKMIQDEILEYMPEEFKNYTVRIDEVNKTGDVRLHGVCLIKGDNGAAPILYLEPYFEMYQEGMEKDRLLHSIADQYCDIVRNAPVIDTPDLSFENIKDNLRVRLVYNRTNYNYLAEHVYKDVGCGYCLVVYADFSDKLFDGAIINIRKDMLHQYDLNESELIKAAVEGSIKNCPARLSYIEDALFSVMIGEEKDNLLDHDKINLSGGVLVLTTEDNFAGAAALFYPGVKEKIAELLDWDYFVLPSSVHEVLLIPSDGRFSAKELAMMVRSVNANEVSKEEQLGNRVLFYDRDDKELCVIWDLDKEKHREEAR